MNNLALIIMGIKPHPVVHRINVRTVVCQDDNPAQPKPRTKVGWKKAGAEKLVQMLELRGRMAVSEAVDAFGLHRTSVYAYINEAEQLGWITVTTVKQVRHLELNAAINTPGDNLEARHLRKLPKGGE